MALYDLKNPYDVDKFDERVKALKEKLAKVELVEKKPQRSLNQNAYAHTLFGYFASEFGLSADYVKYEYFKKLVNPDIFIIKHENKRGQMVDYIRSSASLDTREFTTALERFRNWSAAEAGLYLPAPGETEMLIFAEQQIERYKEYV